MGYLTVHDGGEVDLVEVRAFLRDRLPEVMVPQHLAVLPTLPRTPNGKIDRLALPEVGPAPTADGETPQGPNEELVAAVWQEVLEVPVVDRYDDFFDLGGHSLLATQVLNRLRRRVGVDLPLSLVLEHSVLVDLAAALPASGAASDTAAVPDIARTPRRPGADGTWIAPTTRGQESLWFFSALDPAAQHAYTIQGGLRLSGAVSAELLESALSVVAARHEVLRTTFRLDTDRVVSVVDREPNIHLVQLSATDEAELGRIAAAAYADLDLTAGPLLRVHLVELGPDEHVLLLTVHHIIADGWSLATLCEQIVSAYAAARDGRPVDLPDLPIQYADYAHWQNEALRRGSFDAGLAYWRTQLAGLAPLDLVTDRPRPAEPSYEGVLLRHRLPAAVVGRLRELAADHRTTLFSVLLTPFLVLLQRHSGQRDIAVGTPVAGRFRHELEPLIGLFVNAVVLRAQVRDEARVHDLLDTVRRVVVDALAHQEVPLEAIVEQLRPSASPGSPPLFNVMFNYLNQPAVRIEVPGLAARPFETPRPTTKFDLELYLEDAADGATDLALCVNRGLFTDETGRLLLQQYGELVAQLANDPDQTVGQLRLTGPISRETAPAAVGVPVSVSADIAARAVRHPTREAVWTPGATLDYRTLHQAAGALAARLRDRLPGRGARVGVAVGPGLGLAVALVGVLASGHSVRRLATDPTGRPVDPVDPATIDLLLIDRDSRAAGATLAADCPVLVLDDPAPAPAGREVGWTAADPDQVAVWASDPGNGQAELTGLSHAALSQHVRNYLDTVALDATDRFLVLPEAAADPVPLAVYAAPRVGAALGLVEGGQGDEGVLEAVRRGAATVLQATPGELGRLLGSGDVSDWGASLRAVVLVRATVDADLLAPFAARCRRSGWSAGSAYPDARGLSSRSWNPTRRSLRTRCRSGDRFPGWRSGSRTRTASRQTSSGRSSARDPTGPVRPTRVPAQRPARARRPRCGPASSPADAPTEPWSGPAAGTARSGWRDTGWTSMRWRLGCWPNRRCRAPWWCRLTARAGTSSWSAMSSGRSRRRCYGVGCGPRCRPGRCRGSSCRWPPCLAPDRRMPA